MGYIGSIIGRTGFIGGIISRVGFIVNKIKIRVLIVLMLAKLFLRRYLIYPKLNFSLVAIYSLISSLVHFIGSSSYRVLKSNYRTVTRLSFLTHTP